MNYGYYIATVSLIIGLYSLFMSTGKFRWTNEAMSRSKKNLYLISGVLLIILAVLRAFLTYS